MLFLSVARALHCTSLPKENVLKSIKEIVNCRAAAYLNQSLDLSVKTPADPVKVQGTQSHAERWNVKDEEMKNILTIAICLICLTSLATPLEFRIHLKRTSEGIRYSINGSSKTTNSVKFSTILNTELRKFKKIFDTNHEMIPFISITIEGHADLRSLNQFKPMLEPFGFDHLTLLPSPKPNEVIMYATKGSYKNFSASMQRFLVKPKNK